MLKKISIATLISFVFAIATPAIASDYLANPRSMIFHYASCRTIKKPQNYVQYSSRQEAIEDGYRPCKVCGP